MRNMKGRQGYISIKIDLKKAYDYLRWDFIKISLQDASFPQMMMIFIMKCIKTTSLRALWNGSLSASFTPTGGIR
jgi:hypothetical protein